MKTRHYERSEVISFYELTDEQQKEMLSNDDSAEETSFVLFEGEPLPLNMFMRTPIYSSIWHGVYSTSAWGGYFIRLSACGSMAVVADRYC